MSISIEVLKEAISIKEEIQLLEARLIKILAGEEVTSSLSPSEPIKKQRRKMSAAARAKISAAQKARWAAQKK